MIPRPRGEIIARFYDLPDGILWVQSNFPKSGREPVRVSHAKDCGWWLSNHFPKTRSNTDCTDWCIEKSGNVLACANDMADVYHRATIAYQDGTGERKEPIFPEFSHESHVFLTREQWRDIIDAVYPFTVQSIEGAETYHGKPYRRLKGTYIYPSTDFLFNATVCVFDDRPVKIGSTFAIKRQGVFWDISFAWDDAPEKQWVVEWVVDKQGLYKVKS